MDNMRISSESVTTQEMKEKDNLGIRQWKKKIMKRRIVIRLRKKKNKGLRNHQFTKTTTTKIVLKSHQLNWTIFLYYTTRRRCSQILSTTPADENNSHLCKGNVTKQILSSINWELKQFRWQFFFLQIKNRLTHSEKKHIFSNTSG